MEIKRSNKCSFVQRGRGPISASDDGRQKVGILFEGFLFFKPFFLVFGGHIGHCLDDFFLGIIDGFDDVLGVDETGEADGGKGEGADDINGLGDGDFSLAELKKAADVDTHHVDFVGEIEDFTVFEIFDVGLAELFGIHP